MAPPNGSIYIHLPNFQIQAKLIDDVNNKNTN